MCLALMSLAPICTIEENQIRTETEVNSKLKSSYGNHIIEGTLFTSSIFATANEYYSALDYSLV